MSGRPNDKMFKTMIQRYGSEAAAKAHMAEIGRRGGTNGNTGGFYKNRAAAMEAGRKGGLVMGDQYKTRSKNAG